MVRGLEFTVGLLIWLGVIWDGFATIVLPRTVAPMRRLSGRFYRWSWTAWAAAGRRIGGYAHGSIPVCSVMPALR